MKHVIDRVINEYSIARTETFAGHPLGTFFRNEIPRRIYNTGIVNERTHLVTGSTGQGGWVDSAWFAIFDRNITTSARKGVYVVYLLSKDGNTLYLTFNQGCEDIRASHSKRETISIMRERAREIVRKLDTKYFKTDEDINLGSGLTDRAEMYQKGTICYKEYVKGAIPSEEELREDLKNMMTIYSEYVNAPKPGHYDSWEIVDEKTAIKTCDKSFFDYNGSGVPKEICWFFDAESIPASSSKPVRLIFSGVEYSAKLTNDTTDRRRIQIRWNSDLGRLFDTYKNEESKATFVKKQTGVYEITFMGGEKEMTIKEQVAAIRKYIEAKGFNYDGSLIENFYLGLKSKPFVILAGTSGTGKTRLVRLFAEAIGCQDTYKLVSVRPDWSDSSDLFGHVDLNQKFVPGAIIDFVKQAELNPTKPYFLCLDEMNLARVEYYMSDIISAIETRRYESGIIITDPVVSSTSYGNDTVSAGKYGKVILPGNLYIVGTVNMDETTFPFSKKVLDRANTIEFSYVDLLSMPSFSTATVDKITVTNEFLVSKYITLNDCDAADREYIGSVCTTLSRINSILEIANAHIGYRVRDEIVFYMLNNREADLLNDKVAFDNQIMQKILPRVQGSSESIKKMLEELKKICDSEKYEASAKKIEFMITRYEEDGFTSYWL